MKTLIAVVFTLVLLFPAPNIAVQTGKTTPVVLLEDAEFFDVLRNHIVDADQQIVVSMFLFKARPDSENRANLILEELVSAQKRGVEVRVLLEKTERPGSFLERANAATSKRLKQNGVQVLFDSPKTTTHTKAIVIDEKFVFLGSHNLTQSALSYNHELSVLIEDSNLARDVIQYVQRLAI